MFTNEDDFKNIVNRLNIDDKPNADHRQNLRQKILSTFSQTGKFTTTTWLTLRTITKLAAAAAIIIIGALAITFLQQSATPAYALEQTIQAIQGIRYIHTKYFDASYDEVAKETWIEFDDTGQPKNVRVNWSKPFSTSPTIVVWNKDKTQVWFPQKDRLFIWNDEIYTERTHIMAGKSDPKKGVQKLYDRASKEEIKIEVDESGNKEDPIVVTATYLPDSPKYGDRKVLFVDRGTNLTTRMELYVLKEGEYEYQGVMEYYDYNVPIDARMFTLDDEVPAETHRIDTRTQDIGLAQGDLTDKEIAVEVVRELLQALIAKDYTKVSQIWGGLGPAEVQQRLSRLNIVRIVSIGEPGPFPKPSKIYPKMQSVPCTVEVGKNGQTTQLSLVCNVQTVIGKRRNWQFESFGSGKTKEEFVKRMEKDRELYTEAQMQEISALYQVANKKWNTQEARESLKKLVSKYTQGNRVGCAMLYLGQMSSGQEREDYLKAAIEKYSDCWYGDGVQVGAYARYELALYYHEIGKVEEANTLFNELFEEYPGATDHQGRLLLDKVPEQYKPKVTDK